jgi:hypothetical protein
MTYLYQIHLYLTKVLYKLPLMVGLRMFVWKIYKITTQSKVFVITWDTACHILLLMYPLQHMPKMQHFLEV